MHTHFKLKKKYLIAIFILAFFIAAIILFCRYLPSVRTIKADYDRISSESYDTVFLSMFPIDNYSEEDFDYYLAQDAVISSYCIPNESILKFYMEKIASSSTTLSTVYIGVKPEKISADKLLSILRTYPSVNYYIIFPYPSMDYWNNLSDKKLQNTLQSYRELTDYLLLENNVNVYSFNKEWVICNPANYNDAFLTNKEISQALFLTRTIKEDREYKITTDNVDTIFTEFSDLLMQNLTSPAEYPDLSDYTVVFFGDSVIGNYTNSASIPGVVNGLTGATVYNCGYGGNSAASYEDALINLPGIADAFIAQNTASLPEGTQVYAGVTEYINDSASTEKLCFVINYGLNDYFNGAPVSTDDPYDVASYSGAMRTTVTSLQLAYPEAQIILLTPNFTSYFNNGEDKKSEAGGVLTDYVNAVISLGAECNVDVLDNYAELGINSENHANYLEDGCHPNAGTRFTIGQRIVNSIK